MCAYLLINLDTYENDGNTAVYFFTDATADICSFTKPKETIKF